MKNYRKHPKEKGIALIVALGLLAFTVVFAEIAWNSHIANNQLQKRYQNNLQTLYDLESAKAACMWEEKHAATPNTWDTVKNSTSKLQNSGITGKFYTLTGYNFRAQAAFQGGTLHIYAQAFRSDAQGNRKEPQYLEMLNVNSPLYQFAIFSNTDVNLPFEGYDSLIHCFGGKIHTNGDIRLRTDSTWDTDANYVKLDQVKQLTASGDIMYDEYNRYPAPHIVDGAFDGAVDGKAPAPPLNGSSTWYTTTAEAQDTGPYREYYDAGYGYTGKTWKWYGEWLGNWRSISGSPYMWMGEESYFFGGRLIGNPSSSDLSYLKLDGTVSGSSSGSVPVHRFYLTDQYATSLSEATGTKQYEDRGAYFRPYKDSQGNLVNEWFNIPAGLPQKYSWEKYDGVESGEQPVTFYVTEKCAKGSAGCYVDDDDPNPGSGNSWRYRKTLSGSTCTNDTCYNNGSAQFVKAEDYKVSGTTPYFTKLQTDSLDRNDEFISDKKYGDDVYDPNSPYRQISHFNTETQPAGYQQYASRLANYRVSDAIAPQVDRKDMYLGNLYDKTGKDSAYKLLAKDKGLYIGSTTTEVDSVVAKLNAGGVTVAKKVTFYNWQTNNTTNLIDIDVGKMKEANKAPGNGIIYSKYPVRLSNATNLPGTNSADGKKAVFTVVSEASVYLKGDYNTVDWKVSNISTQKMVYTLSNNFKDPATVPDLAVYPDYPYVYVRYDSTLGKFVQQETTTSNPGEWLTGNEDYIQDDPNLVNWIRSTVETKQAAQVSKSGYNPPNQVDKASYTYNSLFITSYPINDRLENWHYNGNDAQTNINGSILDLYDQYDPNYQNYRVSLGSREGYYDWYSFSTRTRKAPGSWYLAYYGAQRWGSEPSRTLGYDARFPETTPNNFEATLGVTGVNVWRLISETYFNSQIQ
jgi:hypothetical protein